MSTEANECTKPCPHCTGWHNCRHNPENAPQKEPSASLLQREVVAEAIRQHLCGMEGVRGIDREILESRNAALCELAQTLGLTL